MLLLALSFLIVVTVESACDGLFVPFLSRYEVQPLQNVAKQVEIISILQIWAKNIKMLDFTSKVDCLPGTDNIPRRPRAQICSDVLSDPGHEAYC